MQHKNYISNFETKVSARSKWLSVWLAATKWKFDFENFWSAYFSFTRSAL